MTFALVVGRLAKINTNLGTPASSTVAAKIDELHDVRITAARAAKMDTMMSDAVWTAAKAAFVDKKISEVAQLPPKVGGLKGVANVYAGIAKVNDTAAAEWNPIGIEFTDTDTDVGNYKVLLGYTGSGYIEFMSVYQITNSSSKDLQAQLLIDGVQVWGSGAQAWQSSGDDNQGYCLVGALADVGGTHQILSFGNIRFNTSFSLEWKQVEAGAVAITMGARARYITNT